MEVYRVMYFVCTALFGGCADRSAKHQAGGVSSAPPHWPPAHIHGLDPKTLDHCPWKNRTYDPVWVNMRAKELLIRPVDYLHKVNNGKIQP